MSRFSYPSLGSLRTARSPESERLSAQLVPFGPLGGGQWTGHLIGLVIVIGFVAMALAGVPEARGFLLLSLVFGAGFGGVLWLWHRSKAPF